MDWDFNAVEVAKTLISLEYKNFTYSSHHKLLDIGDPLTSTS
jgi:hypothetical protein